MELNNYSFPTIHKRDRNIFKFMVTRITSPHFRIFYLYIYRTHFLERQFFFLTSFTTHISTKTKFFFRLTILFLLRFYTRVLRCQNYLSELNYKHRNNVRWYACLISSTLSPKLFNAFQNNFILFRAIDSPYIT